MSYDPSLILPLAAVLLVSGVAAGTLAGLLGVGGGIVIVPVLFQLFTVIGIDPAIKMHLAVGTSLATIIPTSVVSARSHHRKGAVDVPLLRAWTAPVFFGVLAGTAIAGYVGGSALTAIFAVVALAVAANMAFRPEGSHLRTDLPPFRWQVPIAALIGGLSAMMGIGGGTLTVPTLSLCSYPIRKAVGTAAAIGLVIAVPGTVGFVLAGLDAPNLPPFSVGYANLLGFALIVPAATLSAPWGARLAHKIKPVLLRRAFALFLFLTSAKMLMDLFD